jgi:hypothetical protein
MSVAGPNRPAFEFCDVFSVVSRLSPQFQPKVRDVPALQTLQISARQIACGLLKSVGLRFCSSLPPEDRHLAPANFTNIVGLILNLSTVRQTESHT